MYVWIHCIYYQHSDSPAAVVNKIPLIVGFSALYLPPHDPDAGEVGGQLCRLDQSKIPVLAGHTGREERRDCFRHRGEDARRGVFVLHSGYQGDTEQPETRKPHRVRCLQCHICRHASPQPLGKGPDRRHAEPLHGSGSGISHQITRGEDTTRQWDQPRSVPSTRV